MDHIRTLGSLAMSSRLKRLSERFFQDVQEIYEMHDIDFESKWFPIFHLLMVEGTLSVTEIASHLGITHPAVNLTVKELEKKRLVASAADKRDGRKRLISLTAKGKRLGEDLEPIWQDIRAAVDHLIEEAGGKFLQEIESIEESYSTKSVRQRMVELKAANKEPRAEILPFAPEYKADFVRLNRAWIEKFFKMEEADLRILENTDAILNVGGAIFFAKIGGKVVGTCAILNMGNGVFELAKMGVDEAYQGRGIGRDLVTACIDYAKRCKASLVTLETNSSLKSAIALYKKLGFVQVDKLDHETEYDRADTFMRLDLAAAVK
ncbi:MAG: bifunctional helix-turn-helix transcriptional regulator/GNAT family N-acetyltransferase [Candidatus Obscuribacter phosphatis]|uniref:Bifunctional helix-turn-helix transcriptional regulator/GNAT family N-acetyltransferase n=1 Tax=Candidatus Obscuribacter phosphatis TaxID=1906157 RepID=A0A8J7TNI4_9BACT|nr:bifunctional helix-turn-helix transcriptional regulator/GNAT family N-acetyltransferase [Candidatus Obscuribacter phosphatis]